MKSQLLDEKPGNRDQRNGYFRILRVNYVIMIDVIIGSHRLITLYSMPIKLNLYYTSHTQSLQCDNYYDNNELK